MGPAGRRRVADRRPGRRRRGTGCEPAIGCVAPPGQRLKKPLSKSSNCCARRDRVERARSTGLQSKMLIAAGCTRSVVAVGVVVGGRLAELGRATPSRSGEYGPQLGDRRLGDVDRLDRRRDRGARRAARRRAGRRARRRGRWSAPGGGRSGRGRRTPAPRRRRPAQLAQERRQVAGRRAEVATSGSRSSSAARRLTKVVFAWRSAGGSATSERSKASFSAAIAPSAWFAFEVSADEVVAALGDRAEHASSP